MAEDQDLPGRRSAGPNAHLLSLIAPIESPSWLNDTVAYPSWPLKSTLASSFKAHDRTTTLTASSALALIETGRRARNGVAVIEEDAPTPRHKPQHAYAATPYPARQQRQASVDTPSPSPSSSASLSIACIGISPREYPEAFSPAVSSRGFSSPRRSSTWDIGSGSLESEGDGDGYEPTAPYQLLQ
jgi:hypothetical protein